MYRDHDAFWPLTGLLLLLLIGAAFAALVVGAAVLFRRVWQPAGGGQPRLAAPLPHPTFSAEQVLAERLARGEIEVADYEQRVSALRRGRGPDQAPGTPGPHPP